jgi:nitrogen fixation/metabolism regulation signal transduction histidine kinase
MGLDDIPHYQYMNYEYMMMKKVLADLPIGVYYVHNRTFLWVNEFMVNLLGYSFDELIAQKTRMIYETDAEFERVGAALYKDKSGVVTKIVRKDKKTATVMIHAITEEVRQESGVFLFPHVVTFSVISDDIAKILENKLNGGSNGSK